MNGDLISNIQENDAFLSDPIDQFKNGDTTIILGHPESWLTSTAQEITVSLSQRGLIVGSFLDEFLMNLADHGGSDFKLALIQLQIFIHKIDFYSQAAHENDSRTTESQDGERGPYALHVFYGYLGRSGRIEKWGNIINAIQVKIIYCSRILCNLIILSLHILYLISLI